MVTYRTKAEAETRLRQVEMCEHMRREGYAAEGAR